MLHLNNLIIFIIGPTCVGKTKLSVDLYNYFPIEILNADASMIYKYMDIGTGKPSYFIRSKIVHHLISIKDPSETYSVWDFCVDAFFIVLDCFYHGKIPVFVGGTMMYIWYLQNFFKFFKSFLFNKNFNIFFKSFFEFLTKDDKNGKCLNTFNKVYRDKFCLFDYFNSDIFCFKFVNIFLVPFNKEVFYCKIKNRLLGMLADGFLSEVEALYSRGDLTVNSQSIRSIGYKDLWLYLDNKMCFLNAVKSILKSTIDLSNNQLKWAKKFGSNVFYIENKEKFLLKDSVSIINALLF